MNIQELTNHIDKKPRHLFSKNKSVFENKDTTSGWSIQSLRYIFCFENIQQFNDFKACFFNQFNIIHTLKEVENN